MHFDRGSTGTHEGLVQIDGFVIMETALEPSVRVPAHTHENATIVLMLAGDYRESFRGTSQAHGPLTVIAKPAGEKHANDVGPNGARCLVIELTNEKIREMDDVARPCAAPHIQVNSPASRTGLRIVRELRQPDALTPLALEGAALQLLVELSRHPPRTYGGEPCWMKRALELLHETPPGALRLSSPASAIGVHHIHLARTFRRAQGCSVGEYARRLQVERAMEMLTRSPAPLSEVAVAAGFYDQSHMARAIRRETGMSARQIRAVASG